MDFRCPLWLVSIALAPCYSLAADVQSPRFKPGLWEITQVVSGAPRSNGPLTHRQCVTPEQLVTDPATPLKIRPALPAGHRMPGCELGAATFFGGTATISVLCRTPLGTAQTHWTGPYASESFAVEGVLKVGPLAVQMRSTGKHLGACPS